MSPIDTYIKLFRCISFQKWILQMVSELFRWYFPLNLRAVNWNRARLGGVELQSLRAWVPPWSQVKFFCLFPRWVLSGRGITREITLCWPGDHSTMGLVIPRVCRVQTILCFSWGFGVRWNNAQTVNSSCNSHLQSWKLPQIVCPGNSACKGRRCSSENFAVFGTP